MRALVAAVLLSALVLHPACVDKIYQDPGACSETLPCPSGERPYCDRGLCVSLPPDAGGGSDGGSACSASSDCGEASRPVCELGTGTCRACAWGGDGGSSSECAQRDPARPLCAAGGACVACLGPQECLTARKACDLVTGSCAACKANAECASGLCEAGVCADPATLLYVWASGPSCPMGSGAGTLADPYCKVQAGMDAAAGAGKTLIVLAGTYAENLSVIASNTYVVKLIGVGAPVLTPASVGQPALKLGTTVQQLSLTLDGFVLAGASGAGGHGVICTGGVAPSLAQLTLLRSTVRDNAQLGLSLSTCDLTLDQVKVGPGNAQGGVYLSTSDFTLANTLVSGNGTAGASGSSFGGIHIASVATRKALFNDTIVGNAAKTTANASGIACSDSPELANTVIFGNTGGATEVNALTCAPDHSAYVGAAAANGNLDLSSCTAAQLFKNAAGGDYHPLSGGSAPCTLVDQGTSSFQSVSTDHDLEGRPRPQGSAFDIGAYDGP